MLKVSEEEAKAILQLMGKGRDGYRKKDYGKAAKPHEQEFLKTLKEEANGPKRETAGNQSR